VLYLILYIVDIIKSSIKLEIWTPIRSSFNYPNEWIFIIIGEVKRSIISIFILATTLNCSTQQIEQNIDPPDLSGIDLPVLRNLSPKTVNLKIFDQRKSSYSHNRFSLFADYQKILSHSFELSGFHVSKSGRNGISFYVREEQDQNRRLRKDCVYVSGRLRSHLGKWINVGTSSCKDFAGKGHTSRSIASEESDYETYLSLFRRSLNQVAKSMNEKLISMERN